MSVGTQLTVLVQDRACGASLRSSSKFRVLRRPSMSVAGEALNIIVVVVASALPEVGAFVREANKHHHLKVLLVHADLDERWIGQLLDRAQVRTLKNLLVHKGRELPGRILEAWRAGIQDRLIADAVALTDRLLVISCGLERIEVPFSRLGRLERMPTEERAGFQIDPDGSYLYSHGFRFHGEPRPVRTGGYVTTSLLRVESRRRRSAPPANSMWTTASGSSA